MFLAASIGEDVYHPNLEILCLRTAQMLVYSPSDTDDLSPASANEQTRFRDFPQRQRDTDVGSHVWKSTPTRKHASQLIRTPHLRTPRASIPGKKG